jgi:hypothetical protein
LEPRDNFAGTRLIAIRHDAARRPIGKPLALWPTVHLSPGRIGDSGKPMRGSAICRRRLRPYADGSAHKPKAATASVAAFGIVEPTPGEWAAGSAKRWRVRR